MRFTARNIDPTAANKIHDDDVARQLGFAGALVPGVELWGCAAALLLQRRGEGLLHGGRVALRFRRPIHDGEAVEVQEADDGALVLRGPDGEARAVGATSAGPVPEVDLSAWPVLPPLDAVRPAVPESLPPGPLPTVDTPPDDAADYAARTGVASLPGVLHPGLLLRAVNRPLMRTVDLGPWIHTASDAVFLQPAHEGAALQVRSVVQGTGRRGRHDEVRYDALVLADGVPVLQVAHTALYRLGLG